MYDQRRSIYTIVASLLALADEQFVEQEHPRGPDGEFIKKGTSKGDSVDYDSPKGMRDKGGVDVNKVDGQEKRRHPLKPASENREHWPDHIKALKLPPAWTNVHYAEDEHADLQAIGRDAKGRSQYVYSKKFQATQSAYKFERIHELDTKYENVYNKNMRNRKSDNAKVAEHADCMHLVMTLGLRPGGDDDTQADKQAYGASTLEPDHVVKNDDGTVNLKFTGKKGVDLDLPVRDKKTAAMLLERKAKAEENKTKLFPSVRAASLLNYSQESFGHKTKDFRTLLGTRLAYQQVQKRDAPTSESAYKKAVREVAVHVAKKLGNTPTVALQSYISPMIFAEWNNARQQ